MSTKAEIRKLADAAELAAEQLRDAVQEFIDEHSDRWREGDAGTDWQAKLDEIENAIAALDPGSLPR